MMRQITTALLTAASLFLAANVSAQYSVTTGTATYTELVNPTIVARGTTLKTNYKANIATGAFPVFGKTYGFDHASTQGEETNLFPTPGFIVSETPVNNTIAELTFFANCGLTALDSSTSISYQVVGDNKTGTVKFQWKNMALKNSGAATDYMNMQLWLNRPDSTITCIMGPNQVTGTTAFGSSGGPAFGIMQWDPGFNTLMASAFLSGSPTAPTVSTTATSSSAATLIGVPAAGTKYTFKYKKQHVHTSGIASDDNGFSVGNAFPNPAVNEVTFSYMLQTPAPVSLDITDMQGKTIKTLHEEKQCGACTLTVPVTDMNAGMYFYRMTAGDSTQQGKLMVTH